MSSIEQLLTSIDGRIRELHGEIASLNEARSALTTNGSSPTPSPKPRTKRTARRPQASKPARKRTEVLLAGVLERMLADGDGLTTAAIAKQGNADRGQVLTLLKELESAGRARRTGERRATRWYAITEEDWIQQRAAELARRPRRTSRRKAATADVADQSASA